MNPLLIPPFLKEFVDILLYYASFVKGKLKRPPKKSAACHITVYYDRSFSGRAVA